MAAMKALLSATTAKAVCAVRVTRRLKFAFAKATSFPGIRAGMPQKSKSGEPPKPGIFSERKNNPSAIRLDVMRSFSFKDGSFFRTLR